MDYQYFAKNAKNRLVKNIVLKAFLITTFIALCVVAFLNSRELAVFLICAALAVISIGLIGTVDKRLKCAYNFTDKQGKIVKVHIDSKNVQTTKVGGLGLNRRRFDKYRRDITICDVYIECQNSEISIVHFEDYPLAVCEYFKVGDEVSLPIGAKFPLVINCESDTFPCPVCGKFNERNSKCCLECKIKFINKD